MGSRDETRSRAENNKEVGKMKKYIGVDVYTAANSRIRHIFQNFERIYLSFSGGKDSGVMLNLVADYMRKNKIQTKIGVMILDNEANYNMSLEFMHTVLESNLDLFDVYWCCLPITLPCTVSSYDIEWQCWGEKDKDRWIRTMPDAPYVVNLQNHNFPFFYENMGYQEFWDEFGAWYSQGKLTASLIGIRTVESLNRFRAIVNKDKETLDGQMWTKRNSEFVYNCYPIYDWRTEDIWTANAKFDWEYNRLYDIFYKAGVPVHKMRVASPFMSESKSSLNLYRVIDPDTWAKLCARVAGANFSATYGKQLNYQKLQLPKGHTWKSFVKFLLSTLPEQSGANFKDKFKKSIQYWGRTGRGVRAETIRELKKNRVPFETNGKTRHGGKTLVRVRIVKMPDHCDFLRTAKTEVASWKRLAVTILKNDHTCKYIGYAPNKEQLAEQKRITQKYSKLKLGKGAKK